MDRIRQQQQYKMGMCMNDRTVSQEEPTAKKKVKSPIQDVDIVKVKLKTARDRINNIISSKNRDISMINEKINQKIPAYQQTGNKKQLIALLKAKKDLSTFIDNAEVRLRLVNDKLAEVEMQKINMDTVNVLDDSNQYIKMVQAEMDRKDWRNVLDEAKNKYQLQWPQDQQEVENDPKFQAMWQELGGNKIPKKQVQVTIPAQNQSVVQTSKQKNVITA